MPFLTEFFALDAATDETADGFLPAEPRVARQGIQEYHGRELGLPGELVRLYRPEAEVFSERAMASLAGRPVTDGHPKERVTAKNWRKYAVGQTGDRVLRDGEFLRVPLMIMDSAMVKKVKSGAAKELSLGYTMKVDATPGRTSDGQEYDAIASDIRVNHIALVPQARGGPALRIGDKNMDATVEAQAELPAQQVINGVQVEAEKVLSKGSAAADTRVVDALVGLGERQSAAAAAKAAAQVKVSDAKIATLEAELAAAVRTPEQLDAMAREFAEVKDAASALVGDAACEGKSVSEMKSAVVLWRVGDSAAAWGTEMVSASFATIISTDAASRGTADRAALTLKAPVDVRQSIIDANDSYHDSLRRAHEDPKHWRERDTRFDYR